MMQSGNHALADLGGDDEPSLSVVGSSSRVGRSEFVGALQRLKARSPLSYASLAHATGRPQSTIHGWVSGRHLPYARDNTDFAYVLELLGADDVPEWMEVIYELRANGALDGHRSSWDHDHDPIAARLSIVDDRSSEDRAQAIRRLVRLVEQRLAPRRNGAEPRAQTRPIIATGSCSAAITSLLCSGLIEHYLHRRPAVGERGRPIVRYAPARAGVEWLSPVATRTAEDASHGHLIVVDEFERLLAADGDGPLRGAVDRLVGELAQPRTALVIAVHADHLGAAIAVPMLRAGLEDGLVVADAPGGTSDDH